MSLLKERHVYKPFLYPWAYDAFLKQQQIHWLPEEVPLSEDVKDWEKNLTPEEKNLITHIFRFFVQGDVEVGNCYMQQYLSVFQTVEIKMMLTSFANMECIHMMAYAHLLDTVGMPEVEYVAFLKYKAMKDKYDYMNQWKMDTNKGVAQTLAVFGAFTEGVQLFASFAILMNFPRFNKMKGMGQIITWSVRDETLHTNSITKLFKTFIHENPSLWDNELTDSIYTIARDVIKYEDAFIDLAFEMGGIEGLSSKEVKNYIRYIANRRLKQLDLNPIFDVKANPLPWMDELLGGVEHVNFFENRATEYSRSATQGTWDDAF